MLADLATELIQMVRGSDKADFVERAYRLGVADTLHARLRSGSSRVRLAAAEALADFGDPASLAALHGVLDDPNEDVRLSAALALAQAGHAPPVSELVKTLGIGTSEHSMLVVGLFREIANETPDQIRALVEDPGSSPEVKAAAIEALTALGDPGLVPVITRLAIDTDEHAEELPRYLRALGRFGHPAAAPAIVEAMDSAVWWVRAAAAEAAGRIGLAELSARLTTLLDDESWWVRFRAGEALFQLGGEGRESLADAARSGAPRARDAAAFTLAERGMAP